MSRIDQAWARASAPRPLPREVAARAEHLEEEQPCDVAPNQYPREREQSSFPAQRPDRWAHWKIAAPQTGQRRQAGPVRSTFERKRGPGDRTTAVAVQEYRRLAHALDRLQSERGLKTLIVTSALPKEGKTTTVANLAMTLSDFFARRVLLIDGDLRQPSIHTTFTLPNTCGLSDVLLSERADIPLLQVSATLNVLPAGAERNTVAALTSDRMEDLVEQLAAQFDWVLLDAPPVEFMPEAHLLASLTGAVLFVIGAGSTPYPVVNRAIAALGRDRIVGLVLNRVANHDIRRPTDPTCDGVG
jgi:capsular exopolysaccharide synthesis family protein